MARVLETIKIKAITVPAYDDEGNLVVEGSSESTIIQPVLNDDFLQAVPDFMDITMYRERPFYLSFRYTNGEFLEYNLRDFKPRIYVFDGDTDMEAFKITISQNEFDENTFILSMTAEEVNEIDTSINNVFVYYIELINIFSGKKIRILQGNITVM